MNESPSPIDYKKSVLINSNENSAFKALTEELDKWWSTVSNSSKSKDDDFSVSFGPESYWKFKIVELDRPNRIAWKCIESHQDHNLKGIDEEWLHSMLHWDITIDDSKVKVQLLHKGLISTGVCYDVCSRAWDFYILDSLKSYLETGVGKPGEN